MKRSNKMQVDVDCEKMDLKDFPIAGYPFTVYKKNYENFGFHERENKIRSPPPPIHVNAYSNPVGMYSIPRYRLNYVNKYMDVPVVQKVAKVVEVPEVRQITKYVDVVKVVDVPVEQVRIIPKLRVREVEKIRHVPGPIEYIDIPQEHIVHKPRKEIVEKIHEIPIIEDIEVEVPFYVPTPVGPPEEINIEVPLPYDVPQFCYKPEGSMPTPMPVAVRHITNQDMALPPRTDIVDNEEDASTVKVSQGSSRAMYSSPPLGSYVVNGRDNYRNKYKLRTEEDERMDALLYNYNRHNVKPSLPKKVAYNETSGNRRKHSMNNLNCCNNGYNNSPYKGSSNYRKTDTVRYAYRKGNSNVNAYARGMHEMQEDISTRSPPSKTDQYYYSYSAQNKDFPNYLKNGVTKDEYSFAQENKINNETHHNYVGDELAETYRDADYENYNGGDNIYNSQEHFNDSSINYNEHNSNTYYYGDESNYVYGDEYNENSPNANSDSKVAELIVRKSNRRGFR